MGIGGNELPSCSCPSPKLVSDNLLISYTLKMSIQTNSTTTDRVPALLKRVKKTFEETFEDVSSAKDVTKMLDQLVNQFPLSPPWEQELYERFLQLDHRYCDFRSIRDELDQINRSLRQHTVEADQDDFQALSERERNIIGKADGEDPLVKSLRKSYEFFHRQLKHDPRICLFLSIFPEHAILRKRFLIYWWIGEGLILNEQEGERVFEELLDLHLLQPHRTDKCPRVSKCKIFPWIRYMLISVANKEKLLNLEDNIPPRFDPTLSRRTCLIADHTILSRDLRESKLDTLRTIFNVNERYLDFQHQWLAKLKSLAVLQLGRWKVSLTHHIEVRDESFLTGLKTQKLLKYLSLRGISRITALPDSIKELVSLEIVDLKACHNLETLPDGIVSLRKLTHLDVSECYMLDSMPKGLDKLTSLQVLKGFIIGSSLKTPIRINHLQKSLKRLSIHIGSEASIQKEEFDNLKDLRELKCLKISWGKAVKEEYSLSFPSKLQKLDLEGIPHETKPEWLKPSNLRNVERLYIKGGKLRNLFDYEGEKWETLEYLVLKYSDGEPQIKGKNLKSSSMFPSLKYVKEVKWVQNGEQIIYEWNKDGQ